jgi:deazaflavin-dependent oxidoreductase (nitroreductase family)
MLTDLQSFAEDDFCYLTTTGRVSGRPHTIEIWFALRGETLYMLAGGRNQADWVRNIQRHPDVQVKIREHTFPGKGRIVQGGSKPDAYDEDTLARQIVLDKYAPRYNDDLRGWSRTSLPIAIDLILSV